MTRDEIIRMAWEAHGPITGKWWDMDVAALERFAALVASAEREKCAKFLELIDLSCIAEHESCQRLMAGLLKNCAESIRTRGQK